MGCDACNVWQGLFQTCRRCGLTNVKWDCYERMRGSPFSKHNFCLISLVYLLNRNWVASVFPLDVQTAPIKSATLACFIYHLQTQRQSIKENHYNTPKRATTHLGIQKKKDTHTASSGCAKRMVFGRRRDRTATTRGGGRKRSGIYRMVLFLLGLLLLPGLGIWIAGWLVRHLNQDTQEDLVTPTILGVRNNGADIFYFIVGILLFLITILSLWLAALLTGITGRRFWIFLALMAGLLLFSMHTQVMYYVIGGIDANCSTLRSETLGIAPDALCAGDKILFTSSVWTLFFLSIALPVLLLYLFHILKQHLKRKFTETRYTRTVAATPVTRERERERERTAVRGVTAEDTTTRANRV